MRVSEEAVAKVISELVINRDKRRTIQKMSAPEMTTYLVGVYRSGFEDGAEGMAQQMQVTGQVQDPDEIKRDWEDILSLIGEVKGVGPKLLKAIDEHVRERGYEKE